MKQDILNGEIGEWPKDYCEGKHSQRDESGQWAETVVPNTFKVGITQL